MDPECLTACHTCVTPPIKNWRALQDSSPGAEGEGDRGPAESDSPLEEWDGAPCRTRTCGLLVRSQTLYPTELRARERGAVAQRRPDAAARTSYYSARQGERTPPSPERFEPRESPAAEPQSRIGDRPVTATWDDQPGTPTWREGPPQCRAPRLAQYRSPRVAPQSLRDPRR